MRGEAGVKKKDIVGLLIFGLVLYMLGNWRCR